MAVNPGDRITAARYNTLQNRIAQLLGSGSGEFGYGQTIASSQVKAPSESNLTDGDLITAKQLNDLRSDIDRVYRHQNGSGVPIDAIQGYEEETNTESEVLGDVIGSNQTARDVSFDSNDNINEYIQSNSSNGFNDFVAILDDLEQNRFSIAEEQSDVQLQASDIRTTSWSGAIVSQFDVNFLTADDRRFFFNAGGQIRIEGFVNNISSSNSDSFLRDSGWKDLVQNPGEIHFDYNSTTNTDSSSGVTIPNGGLGNNGLSNNFQLLFKKDASSGLYSNSYWKCEAKQNSSNSVAFKITLVSSGPESNEDAGEPGSIEGGVTESVTADIEFEYSALRANEAITIPAPTFQIVDTFE